MEMKILIPLLVAIVSASAAAFYAYNRDVKLKRTEAYMELIGMKKWMKQVHLSRAEAFLFSDYHEEKWRLQANKNDIDLSEARRLMQRSEELGMEAGRTEQNLAKIVGSIRCYFSLNKDELNSVKTLLNHNVPKIKRLVGQYSSLDELDKVKKRAEFDLQKLVEELFDGIFDPVIKMLENRI